MKRMHTTLLAFIGAGFSLLSNAQNNPFGVRDALYEYVQKTSDHIGEPVGYRMADTLFRKAKKLHDLNAQCLALDFKVWHFHKIGQHDRERTELNRVAPFILKTPYKKYYFSCWNMRIHEYIDERNYPIAINEISKYREKAFALKDNSAITESYNIEGGLYYSQRVYRYALTLYRKAAEYAEKDRAKDIYRYYKNVARAALRIHRFNEAEKNAKFSINAAPDKESKLGGYCTLLSIYCLKDTTANLIRRTYNTVKTFDKEVGDRDNYKYTWSEAMYNYDEFFLKDHNKALKEYASGLFDPDSTMIFLRKAQYAETHNNLKEATEYYIKYCKLITEKNVQDGNFLLTSFVPQTDFDNIELEKEALEERKAMIKLQQLHVKEQVLKLKNERNTAMMIKRDKEHSLMLSQLESRRMAIKQQNVLIGNSKLYANQQDRAYEIQNQKEAWEITIILILTIALFAIFCIYIYYKIKEQKKLKKEKEKAEKSERTKSLFFQNMNHEIRSPLNAIIGFNDLLCSDTAEGLAPDEKDEIIKMISTNSNLLITLVNDVLDLSNLESGSYKLNWVNSDIQHLCHTTLESVRGRQAEGVKLRLRFCPSSPFFLYTDEQRLQQILTNYLTNACKYTETGSITLAYEVLSDSVRFSVTDTGCGIAPQYAGTVFERFSMLDKAKTGNGLGLHICKIIAKLLHGAVYLDKDYHKGARFIFDHPISKAISAIILFVSMSLPSMAKEKQTIPTELQRYQWEIENCQHEGKCIAMTDSLIRMARKMKCPESEGEALVLKTKYYYYQNEEQQMLKCFNISKNFSFKNKLYDAMFLSWSIVINYDMAHGKWDTAMQQIKQLRQTADELKSKTGNSILLYDIGSFYYMQRRYATALSYYLKAKEYKDNYWSSKYLMIGQCYRLLENNEEAIYWLNKSIERPSSDASKTTALTALLECYSKAGQTVNAIRTEYELKSILSKTPQHANALNYHKALYFFYLYILKDKEKANKELFSTSVYEKKTFNAALYYYDNGDYKKAFTGIKGLLNEYSAWLSADPSLGHDYYISQFDYRLAMREKNKLAMHNIQTETEIADNKKDMLLMMNERAEWDLTQAEINNRQEKTSLRLQELKLRNKRAELNRQNIIKEGLQKQRQLDLERTKYRGMAIGLMGLLVCICIFITIYKVHRNARKLAHEAFKAKEAEKKKNEFFESINNDIHQPLDKIISLNKELNDATTALSGDKKTEIMNVLHQNADYLHKLVNNVLDISKLESGTYKTKMESVTVFSLCSDIIKSFQSHENALNIVLMPDKDDVKHEKTIISDKGRLSAAIGALIETSSILYRDGIIKLTYLFNDGQVSFVISNSGNKTEDVNRNASLNIQMAELTLKLLNGELHKETPIGGNINYIIGIPA